MTESACASRIAASKGGRNTSRRARGEAMAGAVLRPPSG
jgi:hypothetical protein